MNIKDGRKIEWVMSYERGSDYPDYSKSPELKDYIISNFRRLVTSSGLRILDVGCGKDNFISRLVYGTLTEPYLIGCDIVDFSQSSYDVFFSKNFLELEVDNVDIVFFMFVMLYNDRNKIFEKLNSVVKSGGYVFCLFHNPRSDMTKGFIDIYNDMKLSKFRDLAQEKFYSFVSNYYEYLFGNIKNQMFDSVCDINDFFICSGFDVVDSIEFSNSLAYGAILRKK